MLTQTADMIDEAWDQAEPQSSHGGKRLTTCGQYSAPSPLVMQGMHAHASKDQADMPVHPSGKERFLYLDRACARRASRMLLVQNFFGHPFMSIVFCNK